jgi:hypothetical protein
MIVEYNGKKIDIEWLLSGPHQTIDAKQRGMIYVGEKYDRGTYITTLFCNPECYIDALNFLLEHHEGRV